MARLICPTPTPGGSACIRLSVPTGSASRSSPQPASIALATRVSRRRSSWFAALRLADAAPGQWHWAEELRTDMISCVRDIGVELADRALLVGDLDRARWAASRALA